VTGRVSSGLTRRVCKGRSMGIGILGGTGPAGRGLAVRLALAGDDVVIGSRGGAGGATVAWGLLEGGDDVGIGARDGARADTIAMGLIEAWPGHRLSIAGTSNEKVAACDLVVV